MILGNYKIASIYAGSDDLYTKAERYSANLVSRNKNIDFISAFGPNLKNIGMFSKNRMSLATRATRVTFSG